MANGARGEIALILTGERHTLIPSFCNLAEIEDRLGEGLIPLARRLAEGRIKTREAATILWCCLGRREDGGQTSPPMEEEQLAAGLVAEYGVVRMLEMASSLLAAFLGEGDGEAAEDIAPEKENLAPKKKSPTRRKPRGGG